MGRWTAESNSLQAIGAKEEEALMELAEAEARKRIMMAETKSAQQLLKRQEDDERMQRKKLTRRMARVPIWKRSLPRNKGNENSMSRTMTDPGPKSAYSNTLIQKRTGSPDHGVVLDAQHASPVGGLERGRQWSVAGSRRCAIQHLCVSMDHEELSLVTCCVVCCMFFCSHCAAKENSEWTVSTRRFSAAQHNAARPMWPCFRQGTSN